jgi:hypothetical protein
MKKDFKFYELLLEQQAAINCLLNHLNNDLIEPEKAKIQLEIHLLYRDVYIQELKKEIKSIKNIFTSGQNCPKQLMNVNDWIEKNYNENQFINFK